MPTIIKLDDHLSNMIAAGEVIEKIASVVKELVENSLDAKADDITINLIDSGMKEIMISDNGIGMEKEDVSLCFLRHATSKIKNQYDLYRIQSLGFRGEALPSISAVSDITIKSSTGSDGYYVHMRANKMIESGAVSMNKGTIVCVKDLFYNTPARLKYLKSQQIELAAICECVDKLAISNPKVRFKLINNKKILLLTNGQNDMVSILGNVYGSEICKGILEVSKEENGAKIKAFLVSPSINKAKRNAITIVVNHRCVRNNSIMNAICEGYDTYIPIGRYPVAVIFLEIDPLLIDVNVHPSKSEIKFSSEEEIRKLIIQTIKEALYQKPIIPNIEIKETVKPVYMENTIYNSHIYTPSKEEQEEKVICEETNIFNKYKEELDKGPRLPYLEYIGQFAGTYLLFQNEQGLYILDQHAAAERIRYEYYFEALGKKDAKQGLLIPILIELTKKETIYVTENMNVFNELGFELDLAGENSFYVREVPLWVINDIEDVSEEIINFLVENRTVDIKIIRDDLAKQISCKGAIKANMTLSREEIDTLMKKLEKCHNPFTCPHGRPCLIKITNYEMEKMFKRVM